MTKTYITRTLTEESRVFVENRLREMKPLVVTPSNMQDVYDIEYLRKANHSQNIDMWALLDNNIVTQIIPLIDKTRSKPVTEEQRSICSIMSSLIYVGIETNPVSAFYERPNDDRYPSKAQDDVYFRIADHIHPQIFADIAMGKIDEMPLDAIRKATYEVENNPKTQNNINKFTVPQNPDFHYKAFYAVIMKLWILKKRNDNQINRLKEYLEWHHKNLISDSISIIAALQYLSNVGINGFIKGINSESKSKVIKGIKNCAWDIYHLELLSTLHSKSNDDSIWLFCTRDQLLLQLSQNMFQFDSVDKIRFFINSFYSDPKAFELFQSYMTKVNNRTNREDHVESVQLNIDMLISELESEVGLELE